MNNRQLAVLGLALLCLPLTSVQAQQGGQQGGQQEGQQRGKEKFDHSCAPCHGRGTGDDGRAFLPGTDALRIKYQGSLPAALEDRKDLNADILRAYVRSGSWSMPPFRKTELSDAEITDIAAYLLYSSSLP